MKITLENGKTIDISKKSYKALEKAVEEPKGRWRAEEGGSFYYITESNLSGWSNDVMSDRNNARYAIGNYYQTSEEAQTELNRRLALQRLKDWALINAPFEPDWDNFGEAKYYACYNHMSFLRLTIASTWYIEHQTELPYFATEEDCKRFIDENEDDLRIVFGVQHGQTRLQQAKT